MKTDSLWYYLFQTAPALFFDLIGQTSLASIGYEFRSIELKQTAFRIDGVFLPPTDFPLQPLFFVEIQFQSDPYLYHRLFAELFLYVRQHPQIVDWQAVILYPDRSLEPERTHLHRSVLSSPQVQRIYLNELEPSTVSIALMQLMVQPPQQATERAVELLQQTPTPGMSLATLTELIETIMVYKFPHLSRQEIAIMLGISELRQTRVFQEGLEQGREEGLELGREAGLELGERSLVLRLLNRRFGELPDNLQQSIDSLSLSQIENLAEALLDFTTLADLQTWLEQHS
uniref:DUF4351 domain-containing protein n=1 Tax=Cyanothece sp. (strain PCC 7425 / ATCC 29141) TaxID=395961 RepID=B8HN48_CYAP4